MMKKISVFSFAILFASVASAQISKGSLFLGGNISTASSKVELPNGQEQEQKGFMISPAIGTAIKNNLIVGVDLTYSKYESEQGSNPDFESNTIGGGVFVRRYVPIGKSFYFFGQGRVGYARTEGEQGSGNTKYTEEGNRFDISLYPGVSFALTKSFHIEAGFNNLGVISYEKQKTTQNIPFGQPQVTERSSFGFTTNLNSTNFTFGVRFIIPR